MLGSYAGGADLVMVFDEDGITGHPDHRCGTEAPMAWAQATNMAVLTWTLPSKIANTQRRARSRVQRSTRRPPSKSS